MVLEAFAAESSLGYQHSILDLLTVGRLWYDAIVSNPRLWDHLNSAFPPRIARLVIKRSKNLPLSLDWDTTEQYGRSRLPTEADLDEILEMAIQHSRRFRTCSISVHEGETHNIRRLLEAPMPAVENLTVYNYDGIWDREGFEEFTLSPGSPLKTLVLSNAVAQWSSPRLIGLQSITLWQCAIPAAVRVLIELLANSPQLESLEVDMWRWTRRDPDLTGVRSNCPITLPSLKDIALGDIPSCYCNSVLTSIHLPSVSDVYVSGRGMGEVDLLEAKMWQPGNVQTAALLGLVGSNLPSKHMQVDALPARVSIRKSYAPGDHTKSITFSSSSDQALRLVGMIGAFLSQLTNKLVVDLDVESPSDSHPSFDLELSLWSSNLQSLRIRGSTLCRSVIRQLAQHVVNPITVSAAWNCPNLESVTLFHDSRDEDIELDVEALCRLIRIRWPGNDNVATAPQPIRFDILCETTMFPNMCALEGELRLLVPVLRFVDCEGL